MNNYKKIYFTAGSTVESAVNELLKHREAGKLACGDFNGITLYSDTVTMDDAYKLITGKTKSEFDEAAKQRQEANERQQREHEEKISDLTTVWMARGREILSEDKWEYWDKIVPVRLGDLYQGMELGCCLDIVKILNNNGTLDEAKKEIEGQGHSGMSFGLVCLMVKEFSDRGAEFVNYVR